MLLNKWEVGDKNPKDIVESILRNRGITDIAEFLHPPHPSTYSLKALEISKVQLNKAVTLIKDAKEKGETVVIYGDYDVDGTCATALLWMSLHNFGLTVFPFIPDRFRDGYGMTISGLDQICTQHPDIKLLISVDNGIVAHEAIKEAQARGIVVVVTDHHEASHENKADALVHSTTMCGTALAWCLSREFDSKNIDAGLDLVGIATIADQMKLTGINRSFAYHGIAALRKSKNIGVNALCENAEIVLREVGTYEIGYVLGPRINAAGRLSNAIDVVRLLCTKDIHKAREIASKLNSLNIQRQQITTNVLDEARRDPEAQGKIVLVVGEYHEGVIGLAAGKLVEESGLPAIVFSKSEKVTKGSARSITGFHITNALRVFEDMFINVGGHEMAAGFTIENTRLEEFLKVFSEYVANSIAPELFTRHLKIDCEIPFPTISEPLFRQLKELEPFGIGNPKPLFVSEGVVVSDVRFMGKSREHAKLTLTSQNKSFDGLLFRIKSQEAVPKVGSLLDVVYSIDENSWNGRTSIQLLIRDFHLNDTHDTNTNNPGKRVSKTRKHLQKEK